ncbi:MAG TPA: hypothetical protein VGK67_29425 [Myxococcales bacterium]
MAAQIDAKKYPRLAGYLSQLPNGLESYPRCEARGTVPRALLEDKPLPAIPRGDLPDLLHSIVVNPPLRSGWIPEAASSALSYLIGDVHGLSEDEHLKMIERVTLLLYNGPVYKLLMSIVSPQTLLTVAGSRWSAMHRGTTLTAEKIGTHGMRLVLEFPDSLFVGLGLRLWANVYRVTLEHSRAKSAKVLLTEALRTRGVFECSWQ